MPIYEYKCEHCGDTFEVLQKFNENPLTECILCHKGPVKKLISVSSFVLKGSGFYVNDYAKNRAKRAQFQFIFIKFSIKREFKNKFNIWYEKETSASAWSIL